jgi:hypothetical protein
MLLKIVLRNTKYSDRNYFILSYSFSYSKISIVKFHNLFYLVAVFRDRIGVGRNRLFNE